MRYFLAICLSLVALHAANAHFIWLVPTADPERIEIYFGDRLKPDQPKFLKTIAHTKLKVHDLRGKSIPVLITPNGKADEDHYVVEVPGKGVREITGHCLWGVHILKELGEDTPFLLNYYPKAILGDLSQWHSRSGANSAKVEIIPALQDGKLRLRVLSDGKPTPRTYLTVLIPGQDKVGSYRTTSKGEYSLAVSRSGTYAIWTQGKTEQKSGTYRGKKYEEIRHYATLTVTIP